ncbi:MAG: ABC transporter permease [Oscillospiraceae bacterium]|nr:ABC transporter permease [Oscillospiraceae bacterium]
MIKDYIATFKKYQFLLENMISRDLKVKYRRSVLGLAWSMLNPILMMLILSAVFSRIMRFDVENFPLYIMSGQTLFSFFNTATSSCTFSIVESSPLIKKVYVPKYIFPLERVLFEFVNLLFSMIGLIVIIIIYRVPFSFTMLLAIVPMVLLLGFTVGFSMVLASLCVFFHDLKHLYSVLITAWMYLTPIIYPIDFLGEGFIHTVVMLNPLTWYVTYFRYVIMYNTLPTLEMNLVCVGWAVIFLLLGAFVMKKTQDKFILYL